MIAVRLFSREELLRKLAPYKCKEVGKMAPGFELWETGWGEPFTLMPDVGDTYADHQFRRVMALIAKTMPPDWHDKNGGFRP